ncbi:MAG: beta-ketoacyl-ACP synthase III [Bacillota bacterium]
MTKIGISSIGAMVPARVLTNSDLEKMVETTDEWIVTRTGIRERHILAEGETMASLVAQAGKIACQRAGFNSGELDFVISSTIAPDRISPAQSYEVARDLQANHAFCFDLNAACSGFIYGLAMAESLLKTRDIKTGLVTAGEQVSRLIDYTDRSSCVLFGDAAAAMVVTNDNPEHLVLYTELGADPTMAEEVTIGGVKDLTSDRRQDFYFRQNGKTVFKFAVSKIKELYGSIPEKVGIKSEQVKYLIPHQANIRIIDAAAKDIVSNNTRIIANIERYGNTSSASIGLALDESWDRFQKGDYLLFIAFGGGLSWSAALVQW